MIIRTVVDYMREAYIYEPGDVRVTIDSDIKTGLNATNMLDPNLPMVPVSPAGLILLEVKYGSFLPGVIRDIVQLRSRGASSFSKYAACRVYG